MEEINENNKVLGKTFLWMFLGLLVSGLTAWFTYSSEFFVGVVSGGTFYIILFAEILVVLLFNFLFKKLPPIAVGTLYFAYALLNGFTLSVIFAIFELNSIIYLFIISALVFGILAFIGYKTNQDLNSWAPYITAFLFAGLILSLINIFFHNPTFDLIVDWLILALFCGATIYDLNNIRNFINSPDTNSDNISIYCAMQIYLDFINIFLRILSIFGKQRD